ncbi:hypothetical protein BDQ17DRAFT_1242041, partial [Cyathus striatus]
LWAPLISEHEVRLKMFVYEAEYRVGEWKGKEVDVFRAWDSNAVKGLNRMMENYRTLEGMDLTFQVHGHLIDDTGAVVGLVTESAIGREIMASDRYMVYSVVAELQKRGYLFMAILPNAMIVTPEGKLRIIFMSNEVVQYYPPEKREELDELAKKYHWEFLSKLFSEGLLSY